MLFTDIAKNPEAVSRQAVLIGDSMARNLGPMRQFVVYGYGGCEVSALLHKLINDPKMLQHFKYVFILIGTNNFGNKEEWLLYRDFVNGRVPASDLHKYGSLVRKPSSKELSVNEFELLYGKLLDFVRKVNPAAKVLCSAILPRYWDYRRRDDLRRQFNEAIKRQAVSRDALYLTSYTVLYRNFSLKEHYYNKDGLHLTKEGGLALGGYFADKLHKAMLGKIY